MNTKNPVPTVDIIIEIANGQLVLVERRHPPHGWALPGRFVDWGESLEQAAVREAKEETSLDIELIRQFHTYSAPDRDPRMHCITTVFLARAQGVPQAASDAKKCALFSKDGLPAVLAFDHGDIIRDYLQSRW